MQNVEEQWLQHIRRIAPASKVEGLKAAEGERVLGVVEEKSMLAAARPAMQAVLQLADDVGKVGDGALCRLQHVHALDGIPQLALLFEVEPVTLLVALDQHAEEAEEELHVLFGLRERERIDCEIARLLADIQIIRRRSL